jgi:hypothetical protein
MQLLAKSKQNNELEIGFLHEKWSELEHRIECN